MHIALKKLEHEGPDQTQLEDARREEQWQLKDLERAKKQILASEHNDLEALLMIVQAQNFIHMSNRAHALQLALNDSDSRLVRFNALIARVERNWPGWSWILPDQRSPPFFSYGLLEKLGSLSSFRPGQEHWPRLALEIAAEARNRFQNTQSQKDFVLPRDVLVVHNRELRGPQQQQPQQPQQPPQQPPQQQQSPQQQQQQPLPSSPPGLAPDDGSGGAPPGGNTEDSAAASSHPNGYRPESRSSQHARGDPPNLGLEAPSTPQVPSEDPLFGGASPDDSPSLRLGRTPSPATPSRREEEEMGGGVGSGEEDEEDEDEEEEGLGRLRPRGEKRPSYSNADGLPSKKTRKMPSLGSRMRTLAHKAVEADIAAVNAAVDDGEKALRAARLEKSRAALAAIEECEHWDELNM